MRNKNFRRNEKQSQKTIKKFLSTQEKNLQLT